MAAAGGRSALSTKIYYGLGSVAFGVKDNGIAYFLLLFYNQVMGVDPWLVSLALLIALCFDASLISLLAICLITSGRN